MEKSVLKEFLKEDIVHFSGKESFKKVTKKSIINYTGSTLGNAFKSVLKGNKRATKDNMLDSILEMRREEDIRGPTSGLPRFPNKPRPVARSPVRAEDNPPECFEIQIAKA